MKQLSSRALGLALTLVLVGCNRAEPTATPVSVSVSASATAATPAVAMKKIDTVIGTGKDAIAGATAVVNYTGWLFDPNAPLQHGSQFDSSSGRAPFSFQLGAGQVIKGWDEGVQGMKAGGKRTLIIPASMGYGDSGAGPIPPNANLIFDVELLEVR
jgi:FKBP-type peptidyl-prolyl cis-trans isomerase FkpA